MGKAAALVLLMALPFGAMAFEDRVDLETGKLYEYEFLIDEVTTLYIRQYSDRDVCVLLERSKDRVYTNCALPTDED